MEAPGRRASHSLPLGTRGRFAGGVRTPAYPPPSSRPASELQPWAALPSHGVAASGRLEREGRPRSLPGCASPCAPRGFCERTGAVQRGTALCGTGPHANPPPQLSRGAHPGGVLGSLAIPPRHHKLLLSVNAPKGAMGLCQGTAMGTQQFGEGRPPMAHLDSRRPLT